MRTNFRRLPLALAAALPLAVPCSPQAPAPEAVGIWRSARNCGPNCLYLLLSTTGRAVSYQAVNEAIEVGPRGTTLLQLRDAARSLGHEVEVYEGTPDDLREMRLPVILHLDRETGDVSGLGHFALLTKLDDETHEATLFDGVTAAPAAITFEALRRMWSGYLLAPPPPSTVTPFIVSMLGTLAACTLLGLVVRRRSC